jgi:hypothetical protein
VGILDDGVRDGIGMERYFGNFKCIDDVINDFQGSSKEDLAGATMIAAYYDIEGYEGSAMVVYRKEGKLYEVHGSHCSCNGLEECWSPEETSYEALVDRFTKAKDYQVERFGNDFTSALLRGLVDEMFDREVLEN